MGMKAPGVVLSLSLAVGFLYCTAGEGIGEEISRNKCAEAVNQFTEFRVSGVYGSPLESESSAASAYRLFQRMKRFQVLRRRFSDTNSDWLFEYAEMSGGLTVVFVFHQKNPHHPCGGPNSFFVRKKD